MRAISGGSIRSAVKRPCVDVVERRLGIPAAGSGDGFGRGIDSRHAELGVEVLRVGKAFSAAAPDVEESLRSASMQMNEEGMQCGHREGAEVAGLSFIERRADCALIGVGEPGLGAKGVVSAMLCRACRAIYHVVSLLTGRMRLSRGLG